MRPLPAIVATAVVLAVGLLVWAVANDGPGSLAMGQPAPDRELPYLEGEGTGSLADERGKWVLVNFWASWCEPCREEAPLLQRLQDERAGEEFSVIGINTEDASRDAIAFRDEFGLTFPMLRDREGERRGAWAMTGLPENFLVDPEGNVALIRRGPIDEDYVERFVEPLVEGRPIEESR